MDLPLGFIFRGFGCQRVIVLRENHTVATDGTTFEILNNRKLLLDVNLIHERSHFHIGGGKNHG